MAAVFGRTFRNCQNQQNEGLCFVHYANCKEIRFYTLTIEGIYDILWIGKHLSNKMHKAPSGPSKPKEF